MARPKKLVLKLDMGREILFNKDYIPMDTILNMNDRLYARYLACKQHALKIGLKNMKEKLNTLSLKDYDDLTDYNKEYSSLKHYIGMVENYIQNNKKHYKDYFTPLTAFTVDA